MLMYDICVHVAQQPNGTVHNINAKNNDSKQALQEKIEKREWEPGSDSV